MLYFYILISTDVKLTTYRPSLVTSYYVAYHDINGRRHLPIHVASPAERDAYHTTHHAVARLPIHRVASPVAYPIPTIVGSAYRYIVAYSPTDTSPATPADTSRPHKTYHNQHIFTTQSTTMAERACGCVPCVACKRMYKGDRGLSVHADRTGCGHRWLQMGGTTYVKRWNAMRRTLPCTCASMK